MLKGVYLLIDTKAEWVEYKVVQQILEAFEKEKVEFAFPTQTLYVHSLNVKK